MNKSQLIEQIATSAGISKAKATYVLDAFTSSVSDQLAKGESVALVGFGTFATKERVARTGRNPQTGTELKIEAATLPSFKAGTSLKAAVNK